MVDAPVPATARAALLVMHDIDRAFGGIPALRKASLTVQQSEIHALVGQNGAGKSTLIKILTGALAQDAGEIIFDGSPVAFASPQAAQAGGISTIYQEINLVPFRSVTENIFLGREHRRFGLLDWRRMNREAVGHLARLNIDIDVRQPLGHYTIAIQQMVAIARALSLAARLVVMDEPTSSLDESEVDTLFGVIRRLRDDGVSVIFVSHRLDELYAICDRLTVLRDGRTIAAAGIAEIDRLQLVTLMMGRAMAARASAARRGQQATAAPPLDARSIGAGRKLRDVSVSVRPGRITGLAGLLGSGRSETARAMFGADPIETGTLNIQGGDRRFASPLDAIRQGIGFCAEDRKTDGIIPDMSVRENLTLALLPRLTNAGLVDNARQAAIVERFIARLGIKTSDPSQPIRELSGGNQQKVLLARWLCTSPRFLLLDEPTRGIDVGAKAEIMGLIEELAGEGLGVLMISSEIAELLDTCDEITVLRDGRTVRNLAGEAMTEGALLHAMAHGAGEVIADE